MKLYRLLTGPDDAAFCKRVSAALNGGWQLHGAPSMTFDTEAKRTICAQAIVKDVDGDWQAESAGDDFRLSDY
ncbi:DUF1737 domain-containing protein [Afifella marina]|uniref:DUF1737 domain-containing protein n=1 Tax=Afifella marina DSM 2698 TaxID=1120955 RepID=A0A1G5NNT7_AFIMA|nr:DUF1737 domain-containing protein [Afifella marina]MBK1624556.1 DUF1737 domain-containing protein [Afifella marina DSM 2698]MBK1627449.1 DUF1737 domain-containing protein [Afifella marina]MBK5918507.1 hypothetical protein [Afifella marina]RAI20661.1 hypothetical protein CH311_09775 [Afifella marina DSM 2698]SCZ39076.1 hypothetical protein SAMN03080610_02393 [Afifella marina DSM 2698]